ncbi:sodium:calcium antiporter [Candidatus Micrarchaeota archaeon]|nr:sodium:calcium antiporter [Candidatus Micrarchaeota archaeon]
MVISPELIPIATLMVSIAVLYLASQRAITHAIEIARTLHISEFAIGFVLVSVATSIPELAVSISGALKGSLGLVVGNVFGANVSDIALVLGITAVFARLHIRRKEFQNLTLILVGTSLLSLFLLLFEPGKNTGLFLLGIFVFYVLYVLKKEEHAQFANHRKQNLSNSFFLFFISILAVLISANYVVEGALQMAKIFNLTETLLGASIVAIGTTLPELSVSLAAVRKKLQHLAIGNIIGSAIVNLTLVLGTGLVLGPSIITLDFLRIIVFSVIVNTVLLYFITIRRQLEFKEGIAMLILYAAFLYILL